MPTAIKTCCLGSKFVSNTQDISRKVVNLKVLSLKQGIVTHLFYASQYRNRFKTLVTPKIENCAIKAEGTKTSFLVMSGKLSGNFLFQICY